MIDTVTVFAGWRETVRLLTHRGWFGQAGLMVKQQQG